MALEQALSVVQQVKSERFAWRLLRQLYEDRIDRQPREMLDKVDIQSVSPLLPPVLQPFFRVIVQ